MGINLRRFVDINIKPVQSVAVNPVRDTATLFVGLNDSAGVGLPEGTYTANSQVTINGKAIYITAYNNPYTLSFFGNGGIKLAIVKKAFTAANVAALDNAQILIASADVTDSAAFDAVVSAYNKMNNLVAEDGTISSNEYGPSAKIFATFVTPSADSVNVSGYSQSNIILKCGTKGIEMSTLAYLTQINVYGNSTVKDYYFTIENIYGKRRSDTIQTATGDGTTTQFTLQYASSYIDSVKVNNVATTAYTISGNIITFTTAPKDAAIILISYTFNANELLSVSIVTDTSTNVYTSDALLGYCLEKNVNIDIILANQIRAAGGQLFGGLDLVNQYVLIVMQQTLQEALINALTVKLSGANGTAAIYNAIVTELDKYVQCGFLSAGNWQNSDWSVTYNGDSYTIIDANARLDKGYKVFVIPFAALTVADIQAHKAPPVYIATSNAYGIRKVTLEGEAI